MAIKINGDNSVATPGFTGDDTDTGLQVGTDELNLVTGGTARATVDSSGNVGIGTTSPGKLLDLNDSSATDGVVLNISNSSTGCLVGVNQSAVANWRFGQPAGVDAFAFYGFGGGTYPERMRIDSSGNVGINQSSPASGLHLSGTSAARFQLSTDNTGHTSADGVRFQIDGSNNLEILQREAANIEFFTNDTERVRIKSDGTLHAIKSGTQITNAEQTVAVFQRSSSTGSTARISIVSGNAASSQIQFGDTDDEDVGIIHYDHADNSMRFSTNTSERMRISSGGRVGIANTLSGTQDSSNSNLSVFGNSSTATGGIPIGVHCANVSSLRYMIGFFNGNGNVGSISTNGSATSYNTSSDYRLKENVVDIADGITRVKQLAPKRFNFIADDTTTVDGFLAHEAQTVVPEAVTGTKDEVDENGNAVMQGIDQSKLVPLLTAALQEAITKIETLETQNADLTARITALETA